MIVLRESSNCRSAARMTATVEALRFSFLMISPSLGVGAINLGYLRHNILKPLLEKSPF
jgi:hypothetical protein